MAIKLPEQIKSVEAWKGGTMLSLGYHNVTVGDAEEGTSQGGDPHPVLEMQFVGQAGSIRDWLHITEKSLGKRQLLAAHAAASSGSRFRFAGRRSNSASTRPLSGSLQISRNRQPRQVWGFAFRSG